MKIYAPVFWPDMVFYFSVSADTSAAHRAERAPGFYESGQDVTGIADPLTSYHAFVDRVMRQYENLALIFEFVTVNAEKSIYDQHKRSGRCSSRTGGGPGPSGTSRSSASGCAITRATPRRRDERGARPKGRLVAVEAPGGGTSPRPRAACGAP